MIWTLTLLILKLIKYLFSKHVFNIHLLNIYLTDGVPSRSYGFWAEGVYVCFSFGS